MGEQILKQIRYYINRLWGYHRHWTIRVSHKIRHCAFKIKFMKNVIFWSMIPYSLVKLHRRFGGTFCFHFRNRFFSCMLLTTYLLSAVHFSEMSVNFHLSTRRHITEYSTVHSHRCENPKPNGFIILCSDFLRSQISVKKRCAGREAFRTACC
jgi:hypothetical protein